MLMTSFAFILGCIPLWIATGGAADYGNHGNRRNDRGLRARNFLRPRSFLSRYDFRTLTADAAFQLDFFGRLRRANEAARSTSRY
jgi:hypothetical protein